MSKHNPLAFVLGGGKGTRLFPLTRDRAKPAVPFGGTYRVIDFVLSNLYYSAIRKIFVLTQYESQSLHRHIKYGWYHRFGMGKDEFLTVLPAIQGGSYGWYRGTADAITQNMRYIAEEEPNLVDIFGGDHIYLMDVSKMNDLHLEKEADFTISAVPVKKELAAKKFGVLIIDRNWQLCGFEEKPDEPTPMPDNKEYCLVSMGNYAANPAILLEELAKDAEKEAVNDRETIASNPNHFSLHDFGFDVIPAMLRDGRKIFVYNFLNQIVPGAAEHERSFWRDIGDLDQFYEANMEIRKEKPPLNLSNPEWEILTYVESPQPAKFLNHGQALDSIVANGVICSGNVERSVLGYNIKVGEGANITDSILLGNDGIGKNAVIKNAIVDKGVMVPDGETVGIDRIKDEKRGFTLSEKGVTVVPRNYKF